MKYLIIPLLLMLSCNNDRIDNLEEEIESIDNRLRVVEMRQNIKKEGVELSTLCKKLADIVELPWEIWYEEGGRDASFYILVYCRVGTSSYNSIYLKNEIIKQLELRINK